MIRLIPMTEEQYTRWIAGAIVGYAEEHVRSGGWAEGEAVERATEETHQLLPNGLQTKNHYFFLAHDDELGSVGIVWYAIMDEEGKSAFLYDIEIQEQYRSRGFGTQTLQALEEAVRPLGVRRIKLHVFGHNEGAFRLYRRLGFVPTNISMIKVLATKISGEVGEPPPQVLVCKRARLCVRHSTIGASPTPIGPFILSTFLVFASHVARQGGSASGVAHLRHLARCPPLDSGLT